MEPKSENKKLIIMIVAIIVLALGIYILSQRFSATTENKQENVIPPEVQNAPLELYTKYVTAVDWPPFVRTEDEAFTCTEAGTPTERAGGTELKTINGRTYCVTEVTEGAAGSTYTQYAYAFPKDNKTMIATFSLKFVQCANYDEPERSDCAGEQAGFNVDILADSYAQGL
ncbi:MAG: hypothetical protein WCT29_00235 [Candidatus Paceibacterota bacterium]|jgi:hypothetical protein